MTIAYPAICHYEDGGYWCEFPDLDGCFSQGETIQEIISNGKEAAEGYISSCLDRNIKVSSPSDITSIKTSGKDFATYIDCDISKNSKSIKKTLTLPLWLNKQAEKASINFSQTLQEALCKKLGIAI